MAFDGIVIKSVKDELESKLLGGRVDKIYQQENDEILMNVYSNGENFRLLLSASSNNPRFYITKHSKSNPQNPPMFCMILRKHLMGGTILNIEQYKTDRIIFIDISSRDELGFDTEKRIVIEIMGRHSNIILINKEDNKIIDSITRVYEDMSRVRQIFPGGIYELPPLQDKLSPLDLSKDSIDFLFSNSEDLDLAAFKFLYQNFLGLSPIISREICYRANIDSKTKIIDLEESELESLKSTTMNFAKDLRDKNYSPTANFTDSKIKGFHCFNLSHIEDGENIQYDSISELLDSVFIEKDNLDRISQKSQSVKKTIQTKLNRTINKLEKQEEELIESKNREKYKIYADLISANIYMIPKGASEIELDNFYDPEMKKITVPLDIRLSAPINAQKYYKKYSKLKTAHNLLIGQIADTKDEIEYLENVLVSIENSTTVEELEEIREELILEGYIKKKINKKKKSTISNPHHYISSDGFNIFVGKNNRQNDQLTFKLSRKDDLWLHVKDMPGSHVIIEKNNKDIPITTLEEAAILAGFYSKGKDSSNLPIDYTLRKNVKKPSGAKAGMVIYVEQETINITPSESIINSLEKKY